MLGLFHQAGEEGADPEYLAIRDHERWHDIRVCLEAMWERFRPYADSNYLDQFWREGHFNARVWEMRLGCCLLDAGQKFSSTDLGPDFSLTAPPVHIEAIAPEPSDPIRAALRELRADSYASMPVDEIVLRFTSAIAAKRQKHRAWVEKKVISPDEPYVIALSGTKFGPGILDPEQPLVLYPLFGIGAMTAKLNGEVISSIEFAPGLSRPKPGGAAVDNFLFRPFEYDGSEPSAKEVSALVFSDRNFRCEPGRYDDMVVIHNPVAHVPIPDGLLPFGREYARRGDQIAIIADRRSRD